MKILFLILSFSVFASEQFGLVDAKIYSLKNKGVKDVVFSLRDSQLTKKLNDQKIFGQLKDVHFKIYWTANPEKIDIQVQGLPEGFLEVREELKRSILPLLDVFFPMPMDQKFQGYKISTLASGQEFEMVDTNGVLPILKLRLKMDENKLPIKLTGEKAIGLLEVNYNYKKESFSDGKFVLVDEVTKNIENGFESTIKKSIKYDKSQGIPVVTKVIVESETKAANPKLPSLKTRDEVLASDYKLNSGEALNYFLSTSTKK